MKEKIIRLSQEIFAWGMAVLMGIMLLVAVMYVAAFVIGMPASEAICGFLDVYILPYVYVVCMGLCLLGVVNMYLCKTHVFTLNISSTKKTDQ